MIEKSAQEKLNREFLTSRLTALDTSLEDRKSVTSQLFPPEQKKERLAAADTDSKGRPVRYFRYMTYEELGALLANKLEQVRHPRTTEIFQRKAGEIKINLKNFLEQERIYDQFKQEFEILSSDFTLENYQHFIQHKLPRIKLFKLHIGPGGTYPGITGLCSLSVGAPYSIPANPTPQRGNYKEGVPVVEFSIPTDEVYFHPLFKLLSIEMEKEVNTLTLKPEWINDIYNGTQDFAERFISDPTGVLYKKYKELVTKDPYLEGYVSESEQWYMLQHWKREESIADLIPAKKLEDIDENNPKLNEPLFES